MTRNRLISRRTALKGLGTAIALPVLEAMMPTLGIASTVPKAPPLRAAFFYIPTGVYLPDWTPAAVGRDYKLPPILESLQPFQQDFSVLSGLDLFDLRERERTLNFAGPGTHARAPSGFLTGCPPTKPEIKLGVSVDQLLAQALGQETRFPSLELGTEAGRSGEGICAMFPCAFQSISWRTPTTPLAAEVNPRLMFERLFSNGAQGEVGASRAQRDQYRKSILDFVAEDASQLKAKLGTGDNHKLDEYLSSIRELEVRITRGGKADGQPPPEEGKPTGIPTEHREHVRLMGDLLVLAFQADVTRVATFMFNREGTGRPFPEIGVREGFHYVTHQADRSKEMAEKYSKVNRMHAEVLAHILGKMKAIKEGDGTLLDNSMIVYGSGTANGASHSHVNLPILLAGHARGKLPGGRHIRYPEETPLASLHLSLLDIAGVPVKSFGFTNTTDRLSGLT
ncbi:MAG: DUF1552 domain-containing protein [Acidobacteria bacterium]|nr:DUF1552 domain-containing protein [Acidobacteriota bacterium]